MKITTFPRPTGRRNISTEGEINSTAIKVHSSIKSRDCKSHRGDLRVPPLIKTGTARPFFSLADAAHLHTSHVGGNVSIMGGPDTRLMAATYKMSVGARQAAGGCRFIVYRHLFVCLSHEAQLINSPTSGASKSVLLGQVRQDAAIRAVPQCATR